MFSKGVLVEMLKKILVLIIVLNLVSTFTLQVVYSAGTKSGVKTITPHEPETVKASVELPIPEKSIVDDRSWLSRYKWWVVLAIAVASGAAAAAAAAGGDSGGDDPPPETEDVEIVW